MKKIAVVTMLAIAMVFMSACSAEFYELKKSPCACHFDDDLAHRA